MPFHVLQFLVAAFQTKSINPAHAVECCSLLSKSMSQCLEPKRCNSTGRKAQVPTEVDYKTRALLYRHLWREKIR